MTARLDLVANIGAPLPTALIPGLARFLYDLRDRLPMFVVYDHPTDRPDCYVARLWTTFPHAAIGLVLLAEDVDPLRDFLDALGLTHLDRQPDDDPSILETWI